VDEDLAALAARAARRLREAEAPALERAGVTMWEYVVLARLAGEPAPSQQELASRMAYDKTRLIALLDGLEGRGLVTRAPEPPDRRAHVVRITPAGRRTFRAARKGIRKLEQEWLGFLSPADQEALKAALARLARIGL
jgi:DNA-binding MarR family transcriptional regulator